MDETTKKEILQRAKEWMRDELAVAHKANTLKLVDLNEFTINPFLWSYLAHFLEGNKDYKTLAKVLVYPRVLGTSINTSFGQRAQQLITRLFSDTYGSAISGIDIEFEDKVDGRKKYCQVKAGPQVVNHDDVTTVKGHFTTALRTARTNQLPMQATDLMFCLLYGEESEKNGFVKAIESDHVVVMGKDFWHRFTGDEDFYSDLIEAFGEVAIEVNMKETVESVIEELANKLEAKYKEVV